MLAVVLSTAFKLQNVAYLVSVTLGVAASYNFQLLVLAIYWGGLTTAGAMEGGTIGLLRAILLTVFGPADRVTGLGHSAPVFPIHRPG